MTETPEAGSMSSQEGLSTEEALATIERATGYEEPLRRRTEGVTWILWGLVTAGIALGFGSVQEFFRTDEAPSWYYALNLVGWVAVGALATLAVWRIAGYQAASLQRHGRRSMLGGVLWLPIVYVVWGALVVLGFGLQEAAMIPLAIGGAWTLLGAFNLFKATETGRRSLLIIGFSILAAATVFALWSQTQPSRVTFASSNALIVLAGGGIPFVVGLYQSMRG